MRKYPYLSQPITLGNVTFRNRMFASPIGATDIDKDCVPGERTRAFYELRGKGGAAAVTVSELVVHPQTDGSHMLHLDLATVGSLAAFTFLADSIKRHGAIPSIEFSHSGQYAGTYMADKEKKQSLCQYGPSDGVRPDGKEVRALTKEQIAEIVESYANAAVLAKRAGFEMIMIHGGHTWLLNQFLSPYFNKRTDEYGGSFENRMRFTLEVLTAVRQAVGPMFPIEFRMSGSELFEGGYDIEEGIKIAQAVEPYVDLIHVSAGSYQFGFFRTHPSMFIEHGCNVYLAAEIKKHVKKPVATIGGLNDPKQMEEILATGKADVVYMGRALLADPYLPQKVMAGEDDKIVKCLRCFTCMAERPTTQTRRCTVNPLIGREIEGTEVLPAARKKKVLVVGGGVAGLKAAVTAAQRGHEVILCEKSKELGGILKCEQAIDFKQEMYQLGLSLEAQAKEAGVEIRLNTRVTEEYAKELQADVAILAVGSLPIVPPIKGIEGDQVVEEGGDMVRYYQYCTAFPSGTLLAQTFDTAVMEEFGKAVAEELKEYHVDWWLDPGMNINRNPLCGRNFEYFSEDPLLTGKMAAAEGRGVQSDGKVGITIKHFACNNAEDNRQGVNSILSQRALREIYLRGFEIAVKESKPCCIMTSYNLINGIHAANNRDLCTIAAREEWGFDGIIMTDWTTTHEGGGSESYLCTWAGNDLIMPGHEGDPKNIKRALENGTLSEQLVRDCARRLFQQILRSNQYEER